MSNRYQAKPSLSQSQQTGVTRVWECDLSPQERQIRQPLRWWQRRLRDLTTAKETAANGVAAARRLTCIGLPHRHANLVTAATYNPARANAAGELVGITGLRLTGQCYHCHTEQADRNLDENTSHG